MPRQSSATSEKNPAKPTRKSDNKSSPAKAWQAGKSEEDRQDMISTAAYYRAERRGFSGGGEVQDWLDAEAEIDAMLYH